MKQYLIFRLANQHYAMETTQVIQVAKEENLVQTPFLSEPIKGLMLIRNCIVPIVDIKTKWKMATRESYETKGHIIVMDLRGQLVGYWVDEVIKIGFWSDEALSTITWSKVLKDKVQIKKVYTKEQEHISIVELEAFEME